MAGCPGSRAALRAKPRYSSWVILGGARVSQSEILTQSKNPFSFVDLHQRAA